MAGFIPGESPPEVMMPMRLSIEPDNGQNSPKKRVQRGLSILDCELRIWDFVVWEVEGERRDGDFETRPYKSEKRERWERGKQKKISF